MGDNRTLLLAKGWCRHAFIADDGIELLLPYLPDQLHSLFKISSVQILLATYDCAIVHESFDDEPWMQLLLAIPIDYDKQFANGRNSRKIHFHIDVEGSLIAYEINAAGICQVDRKLLIDLNRNENTSITPEVAFDLRNWLAERFRQDAWPDSFNRAVSPANKRLKKFWGRYNDYISGLYIKLNTFDEITTGKYKASIIVCLETEKVRPLVQALREKDQKLQGKELPEVFNKIVNEIRVAFGETIDYEEDSTSYSGYAIEVMAENSITLEQLRKFPRYSPYSLSLFEGGAPLPVEMIPKKSE